MNRKPNYQFERAERERAKAAKLAQKTAAKVDPRDVQPAEPDPPLKD